MDPDAVREGMSYVNRFPSHIASQYSFPVFLPVPGPNLLPGNMLISLELLPKDTADAQPVGAGRNEPNQNPYLPPPTGRMNFSFNPVRLSMSLLGPKAFYKVDGRTTARLPSEVS